ncbi:hypothetical protein GCM10010363_39430 [Streptomyces omiyaensis]|nr:hypothetical protein GCM10010363_39430 [Streptomyces omiyaensis]
MPTGTGPGRRPHTGDSGLRASGNRLGAGDSGLRASGNRLGAGGSGFQASGNRLGAGDSGLRASGNRLGARAPALVHGHGADLRQEPDPSDGDARPRERADGQTGRRADGGPDPPGAPYPRARAVTEEEGA